MWILSFALTVKIYIYPFTLHRCISEFCTVIFAHIYKLEMLLQKQSMIIARYEEGNNSPEKSSRIYLPLLGLTFTL